MSLTIAQPGGMELRLAHASPGWLSAVLAGGGLTANTTTLLDSRSLREFFAQAATGDAAPWGRWEYKGDDDALVLYAAPDQGGILLSVAMLATADDESDWHVNGTILVATKKFRELSREAQRLFG